MELTKLKKAIDGLGNPDIDFYYRQVESLAGRNDIEVVFSGTLANGKSTLINALLGRNLLPASLGATTGLVTTIEKGDGKIVLVTDKGEKHSYPLEKASIESITQEQDSGTIEIFLEDFPYRGIRFVDTPGIDDLSRYREERTIDYVPLADTVVFVLDASKGMTAEEKHFFTDKILKANKDKIFIVLNKIDAVGEGEEVDLAKLVPEDIRQDYKVYAVSALKYLAGTLKRDEKRKAEGHLDPFIADLDHYLQTLDKQAVLDRRIRRALTAIQELADRQYDTLIGSVSMSQPELEAELLQLDNTLKELKEEKSKLEREIDDAVTQVKNCMKKHIEYFSASIKGALDGVEAKEFQIDIFNEQVPRLAKELAVRLKQCSQALDSDISFSIDRIDDLHLIVLRNIDDVVASVALLLTFVPMIGEKIKPFIPTLQKGIRRLVDQFGGMIIENAVEKRVDGLMKEIETSVENILKSYKNELLDEYEHSRLGMIRARIVALESTLDAKSHQKENIALQIDYFEAARNELFGHIKEVERAIS
jgi:small GTP-binding protein